jgi:MFS family permease
MAALLAACALGWSAELLVQATLPLLILDRGGDASLVGFVAAAYALPTLLLRPVVGRRVDRTGHGSVHKAGAALLTLGPLGYLLPVIPAYTAARLVQGLGWAMFGTANNVVLARLAPPERRGEASAWFNIMWALGFLGGPPLGLALYAGVGPEIPFVAAAAFAATALAIVTILAPMIPTPPPIAEVVDDVRTGARGLVGRLVEPAALPTMAILATFMAGQALYLTFAPVYARAIGAPDTVLALHFPVYGAILAVGQLVTGRLSDRFGRPATIVAGCVVGAIALTLSAIASDWSVFAISAAVFALAAAIVNPAAAAATIDRAPAGRTGVAMATFSMGYQLAAGLGGAAWGLLIAGLGFPAPFVVAIGLQVACAIIAIRGLRPPLRPPAATNALAAEGTPT